MIAVSLVMHAALPGTILAQNDEFTPGLIATFEQPDIPRFYRVDPQVVLETRAIPPDRRMKAEPFKVTWKGMLETEG